MRIFSDVSATKKLDDFSHILRSLRATPQKLSEVLLVLPPRAHTS
jgi:hypothetical protein